MKKSIIISSLVLLSFSGKLFSQVKIGNNPTMIGASSLLELESTTKGFVIPRMTTAQLLAIASPVQGMLVYNADSNCVVQRTASAWQYLCQTGGPNTPLPLDWHVTGNTGTLAGTNFIGTTDANDFVTKTNSAEAMRVSSAGNVGIGTTVPGSKLDVKGVLRLSGSTSGYVGFQGAAAAGSATYTLPSADGTNKQVLTTNGSGTLSWSKSSPDHLVGSSSNVTYTAGPGLGTGPTITVTGNDIAGKITVTPGSSPAGNSTIITINFITPFTKAPYVNITPGNLNTAALTSNINKNAWVNSLSTTSFTIDVASTALGNAQFIWYYMIAE
jgi:hypothetical protein